MNRRRAVAVLTLLTLAVCTFAAFAQQPRARAVQPTPVGTAASVPVATVGGRPIATAELDQRTQQLLADYGRRKGGELPQDMHDLVRRQVLEGLIRAQLLALEAKRLGLLAPAAEGEASLRQLPVFNPGGRFDSARFDGIKVAQPAQFKVALQAAREQLGARKLSEATERRMSPPEAETRAGAARALTLVTADLLSLRAVDFAGTFEEPRESQIEAWYGAHLPDYRRSARATLTVVFVNSPALADSFRHTASAVAEWNQRMRADAERIIGRVLKGEALDSAAAELGPRGKIVVESDNFPGYWHGTPAQSARVFDAAAIGSVLTEPIRGADGWLVVRVDEMTPAYLAPLREVARDIRARLRQERRLHRDDYDLRALYAEIRDSLAAPGWPIRYAAVDTATVPVSEPGPEELDTYFRSHQAEYAWFDPKTGGIVSNSFADVRDDVRLRYLHDRRQLEARSLCDRLLDTWTSGRRDPKLEARLGARVTPALVAGSRIDTGLVASTLSDTLWALPNLQAGGVLPYARGFIVWQGMARVDQVNPTFEQARKVLVSRLLERRTAAELQGARALYDSEPGRFRKGDIIHFTRVNFTPRPLLSVTLTREEVEKWHRDHIDRYSAPEMVSARHILISPANKSAAADRQALAKATEILRRVKAGEDFTALARAYSEDPATRDIGGDLGSLARGTMLEDFENVVFTLPAGTLYDKPLKTELGYHIVKVTEHLQPVVKPLPLIYAAVSGDAASDKAARLAEEQADSLLRAVKNPRAFAEAGARAGAAVLDLTIGVEENIPNPDTRQFFAALRATPAGHIVPGTFPISGQGAWLAVVDSMTPAGTPTWDQARNDAISRYRLGAGHRALERKRAELDSLLAGGMSFDSLGTYWGGLVRITDHVAGRALPFTDSSAELDSLLFGGRHSEPGLAAGRESGWVPGSGGLTRVRIVSRTVPGASQLAERAEQIRKAAVEQQLRTYFDGLMARYPVVISDRRLRDISPFTGAQAVPAP